MSKQFFIIFFSIIVLSISAQDKLSSPILYKNNISIKPFNINSTGMGIGVHFERYLDASNNFSIVIPFEYSFELINKYQNYYYSYPFPNNNISAYGISTSPGFRFYFVEPRSFNWYLGSSIAVGYSRSNYSTYDFMGNNISYEDSRSMIGSLVNVGFKGTIKHRFTYNLEFGNGIKFYDKLIQNGSSYNNIDRSRYMGSLFVGFGYNF